MLVIDLNQVRDEQGAILDFLRSRTQATVTAKGNSLVLEADEGELSARDVKMLLKKFLHQRGLDGAYRVVGEREVVRIVRQREKRRPRAKSGVPPSPYDTMPYFFPNRTI